MEELGPVLLPSPPLSGPDWGKEGFTAAGVPLPITFTTGNIAGHLFLNQKIVGGKSLCRECIRV